MSILTRSRAKQMELNMVSTELTPTPTPTPTPPTTITNEIIYPTFPERLIQLNRETAKYTEMLNNIKHDMNNNITIDFSYILNVFNKPISRDYDITLFHKTIARQFATPFVLFNERRQLYNKWVDEFQKTIISNIPIQEQNEDENENENENENEDIYFKDTLIEQYLCMFELWSFVQNYIEIYIYHSKASINKIIQLLNTIIKCIENVQLYILKRRPLINDEIHIETHITDATNLHHNIELYFYKYIIETKHIIEKVKQKYFK